MKAIDLNCDLGEGAGNDAALMPLISSANIACGGHAGDARTMRATIRLAREHGVAAGAHPGYADRADFGRADLDLHTDAIEELVKSQVEALLAIARDEGVSVRHVKPHGALYNRSARHRETALAIARAVAAVDRRLILFGQAGGASLGAAAEIGLMTAAEAFADRVYQADGSLMPRDRPGAVIIEPARAVAQALELVLHGSVTAADGSRVRIAADTICLHGDAAGAVEFARSLRAALAAAGVAVAAVSLGC